jgi:hypothetical protein
MPPQPGWAAVLRGAPPAAGGFTEASWDRPQTAEDDATDAPERPGSDCRVEFYAVTSTRAGKEMAMTTADDTKPTGGIYYILLSFVLWMIVEFVTVWNARLDEWVSLMPWVLIQYLVIIMVFWYFIFRKNWAERRILLLMLTLMYMFEFLWQTPFLLNPVTFIPGSLLLASIWGFLTFLPCWLTQGTLKQHKLQAAACLLWIPIGFIVACFLG